MKKIVFGVILLTSLCFGGAYTANAENTDTSNIILEGDVTATHSVDTVVENGNTTIFMDDGSFFVMEGEVDGEVSITLDNAEFNQNPLLRGAYDSEFASSRSYTATVLYSTQTAPYSRQFTYYHDRALYHWNNRPIVRAVYSGTLYWQGRYQAGTSIQWYHNYSGTLRRTDTYRIGWA